MMESEAPEGEQLMTGVDYSVLLVRHTAEQLYEVRQVTPTHEQIAEHLGTTVEMVTALLRGEKRTFGRPFFEKIAAQNGQRLADWMRDYLIMWEMDLR